MGLNVRVEDNIWSNCQFSVCPPTLMHTNASSIEAYEQSEIKHECLPFIGDPYGQGGGLLVFSDRLNHQM